MGKILYNFIVEDLTIKKFLTTLLISQYGYAYIDAKNTNIIKKENKICFFTFPNDGENGGKTTFLSNLNSNLFRSYQYWQITDEIYQILLWDGDGKTEEEKRKNVIDILKNPIFNCLKHHSKKEREQCLATNKNKGEYTLHHFITNQTIETWFLAYAPCIPISKNKSATNFTRTCQHIEGKSNAKTIYERLIDSKYHLTIPKATFWGENISINSAAKNSTSCETFFSFLKEICCI